MLTADAMPRPIRPRPRRSAAGLNLLLRTLGWSGREAAQRLGISHPTLIGLREGKVRPGIVVMDTCLDNLRALGYTVDLDGLFPRDPGDEEWDRGD